MSWYRGILRYHPRQVTYLRRISSCILYSFRLQPVGPTCNCVTLCWDGQSKEAILTCHGHKSHLVKLFSNSNTDEIPEILTTGTLSDTEAASFKDYRKHLKQKADVFADINQKIINYLNDKAELEAMVLESKELQTTLSQKYHWWSITWRHYIAKLPLW